ncbi:hypothetical protein [Sulfurimonas sp.]|nr:hypothetical protein [Sulfurimonas sp.]MBW6488465.1 hypothetical protein [Sulfurimonas sp.]
MQTALLHTLMLLCMDNNIYSLSIPPIIIYLLLIDKFYAYVIAILTIVLG